MNFSSLAETTCCNFSECAYYFKLFVLSLSQQMKVNGLLGNKYLWLFNLYVQSQKAHILLFLNRNLFFLCNICCFLANQNSFASKRKEERVTSKTRVSQSDYCILLFLFSQPLHRLVLLTCFISNCELHPLLSVYLTYPDCSSPQPSSSSKK